MKTVLKSFSAIGALSLLAAGIYINSDTSQIEESITDSVSQQFVITGNKEKTVQIPFADEINKDTEKGSDLQGVKVIPKPTPKPEPVKTPIQKPVVKPEPVKENPIVETKEQPVKEIKTETVKPEPVVEPEPEEPATDNVKAIDRARDITKGYCAPELWVKWNPDNDSVVGQAHKSIYYWEDKSNPDIQTITTMISPELDGDIDTSIHTAWHECAHAKTYSIQVDKVEEIVKEINKVFPETEYSRIETLADAMATVKTGTTENNYYHKDFTPEQLALAEKIWTLSPEITTEMEYDYDAYKLLNTIK